MSRQRAAQKIVDLLADGRYTVQDIEAIGYHIVNLSHRQVRNNALVMADSIMYHDAHPFDEGSNDDTLF
jgi:hypothetical protein